MVDMYFSLVWSSLVARYLIGGGLTCSIPFYWLAKERCIICRSSRKRGSIFLPSKQGRKAEESIICRGKKHIEAAMSTMNMLWMVSIFVWVADTGCWHFKKTIFLLVRTMSKLVDIYKRQVTDELKTSFYPSPRNKEATWTPLIQQADSEPGLFLNRPQQV